MIGRECDCGDEECVASEKYFQKFDESFRFSLASTHSVAAFVAESIQVFCASFSIFLFIIIDSY